MGNDYRLENVGNSELLTGLSELVQESNVLTGRMLAHLVELERRPKARRVDDSSARMTKGSDTDVWTSDSRPVAAPLLRRLHFCLSQSGRERAVRCHWIRISARCPKRFCPPNMRYETQSGAREPH